MTIRILVSEGQEIVRYGLRFLAECDDSGGDALEIAAEANHPHETLSLAQQTNPDIVLLGAKATAEGLTALEQIRQFSSDTPVLMYAFVENPGYVFRAHSLGAAGLITKRATMNELAEAIRTVASGGMIWDTLQLRRAASFASRPLTETDVEAPLTDREIEVLRELASGRTNKKIAESLGISYETVKEHVQHILRKIGVMCRTQAAVWAVRNGIV